MKRCPKCGREYDTTMMFCLDDGAALLYDPASMSEPKTAIISSFDPGSPTAIFKNSDISKENEANSIAVLPFINTSADDENEYFCDGLAEELLNSLAKIDGLKVAARTSAFSFKGNKTSVNEIGERLGVKNILEGSVRRSGSKLRISVQLVNATDGYQLWSERYDREMKDIFDIQDEIAVAVVDVLKIKLLGEQKVALLKRRTQNSKAYEFYLRGLSHFNKWTPVDFEKAIEYFGKAIELDPGYASAYCGLADAYTELGFFSFRSSSKDSGVMARGAAESALTLDDSLAEAHNSMALIKMYFDWDYNGAETEFKRAIQLNPGNASVHMWYGWFLGLMARFDESIRELRLAQELDPLAAPNINAIGVVLHWAGEYERAIEQFREVLELYQDYPVTLAFLAEAYVKTGDMDAALATISKIPTEAMDPQALSVSGYVYAMSGDHERALDLVKRFSELSGPTYIPAINFAHIYVALGDHDQAFAYLDTACDEQVIWLPFSKVDVKFDPLRSDPRFQTLLRRVGFTD